MGQVVDNNVTTYKNFINGKWTALPTDEVRSSINPANVNEVVGYVQSSSSKDVDGAVAAAKLAQKAWGKLSGAERGDFLYKVANIIERRLDDIAVTATKEMGKTLQDSEKETENAVDALRYYAGEGVRTVGDVIPSRDTEILMFTTRAPLGVVGVITPWNFPVANLVWKIAPAIVYGNTVVLKPALETSVTAVKIIECFAEAGVPAGVVNMVTGQGGVVGQRIIDHSDIDGITFTGSNAVGKMVAQGALDRGAKYQLEMGGKNPLIVANDADLNLAVESAINAGVGTTGQRCTATSRVFIHSDVYDEFKDKLLDKLGKIKIGSGMQPETWMGPCASESQFNTVLSYIQKGIEEGATLIYGGEEYREKGTENGFYIQPTVFENVNNDMVIAREEIFGPVLALIKVESIEEALKLANHTKYGLSASIYTRNIGSMLTFINESEAGVVRVNMDTTGVEYQAPFGGMKQSSNHSRELGQAAIEFFTSIKTVSVKA